MNDLLADDPGVPRGISGVQWLWQARAGSRSRIAGRRSTSRRWLSLSLRRGALVRWPRSD
jgi:hypothetical protein